MRVLYSIWTFVNFLSSIEKLHKVVKTWFGTCQNPFEVK